jgi:sugar/nucleoside kinase (ribokinase family)
MKKFLPRVKVLSLNRDEALEFRKLKDIKGLIKYIQRLGPKIVVITDGDKGAYAYDGSKYYFIKAKPVKALDTVGVGDAFGSALTSALIYGKDIKSALAWGIKNSASCVSKVGAQNGLLTKKQIER